MVLGGQITKETGWADGLGPGRAMSRCFDHSCHSCLFLKHTDLSRAAVPSHNVLTAILRAMRFFFFRSRTPTTAVTNGFPSRNLSSQRQFVDLQCTQEIRGCGATLSLQPCAPEVPRVLGKYHFAQGAVSRISAAPLSSTPQNMSPAELFICGIPGRHQEADAENLLTLKVFAFGRRSLDRNRMRTWPRSKLFAIAYRQGRSQNMEKVDDKSPFRTQVVQMFKG